MFSELLRDDRGDAARIRLYAAMVPAIIAALFGSSFHLVSGPTTAASIVLFSSLSALAEPLADRPLRTDANLYGGRLAVLYGDGSPRRVG